MAHVFKWYQAGGWKDIELHSTADGARFVVWNGDNVGGGWGYEWATYEGRGHGVFKILFHCKGIHDQAKEHTFKQVEGTRVYQMQPWWGPSRTNPDYDEVLLVTVEM